MAQVLFFGASVMQGVGDSEGGWADRLKRELHGKMYGEQLGEKLGVFNLGMAGDTTEMLAQRMPAEIEARRWRAEPYVIVISVGINDSRAVDSQNNFVCSAEQYQQHLQRVITIAQGYTRSILLVGLTPPNDAKTQPFGNSYFTQNRIQAFDAAMGEAGAKLAISKVDILDEFLARPDWQSMIFDDGLHPNAQGHAFIADRVRPDLWKLLGL